MRRRSKKVRNNNIPSSPAWMTSYGDMMTLLLVFFVLLFSFSSLHTAKFEAVLYYLQDALGLLEAGVTLSDYEEAPTQNRDSQEQILWKQEQNFLEELKAEIDEYIGEEGLEEQVITSIEERGLVIRFYDRVLFELGSADLHEEARSILGDMTSFFLGVPNEIMAEGHTDDLPINTYRFPSNWELSATRACAVLRYMIEYGIEPNKISAAGYGEHHPIAPNLPEGQPLNRRVDLIVLRDN